MIPTGYTPAEVLDTLDPGDDTLRNFRYQLYYGIILLIRALHPTSSNTYVAIYCEHHDDFLCELPTGLYDAIQVKSRKKENGSWRITDPEMLKTIHRFYKLISQFPTHIGDFYIVSNAEYQEYQGADEKKIAQCPEKFCMAASSMPPLTHTNKHIVTTYRAIKKYFADNGTSSVDDGVLCNLLSRIKWATGPDRDGCYDYIAARQLPQLPHIKHWTATTIDKLTQELLVTVLNASSKHIQAPDQWTTTATVNVGNTTAILHKRIAVADIKNLIDCYEPSGSNLSSYYTTQSLISSDNLDKGFPKTTKKMAAGGIEPKHILRVKACASQADNELLELLQQHNMDDAIIKTIHGLVETACDEAELAATAEQSAQPYGRKMLHQVYERLHDLEANRKQETERRKFECLLGVAGLLTESCRVWWSPEFDINAA